jgi:hypothetical protein
MALAQPRREVAVGDLIAAAYDEAAALTSNHELAAHLAAGAVEELLIRTGNERFVRRLALRKREIGRIVERNHGAHCCAAA